MTKSFRVRIAALALGAAHPFAAHAIPAPQSPMLAEEEGMWGYKDAAGAWVVPPKYALATDFTRGGIAAVAGPDGLQWIDRTGNAIAQAFSYDNGPDPFVEGRARIVGKDGRIGFIDAAGTVVIPATWDFATPVAEGRSIVCTGCRPHREGEHTRYVGGTWGAIDADGNITLVIQYPSWADATAALRGEIRQAFPIHLDPSQWTILPTEGLVVLYSDTGRQVATTHTIEVDLASIERAFGGLPEGPADVLVTRIGETSILYKPDDPMLPVPEGGFHIDIDRVTVMKALQSDCPEGKSHATTTPPK